MKDRGFTLVELLVVVSIVALLAAFILPGLSRAREYAYFTSCKSSLRQIGIGLLTYAADFRGVVPEGDNPCTDTGNWTGGGARERKIGLKGPYGWDWWSGSATYRPQKRLLLKIYQGWTDIRSSNRMGGRNWYGKKGDYGWKWVGDPHRPGRYLPIEIFWCPIVKVRDWGPIGTSSEDYTYGGYFRNYFGTERDRDMWARRRGVFGYQMFINTTGCSLLPKGVTNHTMIVARGASVQYLRRDGGGWRPNTRYKSVRATHKPSVWLAADLPPHADSNDQRAWPTRYRSHFGTLQTIPGEWRYNVLHLDGHVHDEIWRDTYLSEDWALYRRGDDSSGSPWVYGWEWVDDANVTTRSTYGIRPKNGFTGAFDETD
jgi:prepilin-type N-terminal cleavage/methylation domain-containing protein